MSYYNIYQDVLFYISCVGLVCCGIMILLVGALPTIWDTFTTAIGKNRTTQLIMLCFAVGAIMYGGTKNDGPTGVSKFIFDKYLLDNGSYSTNDTIVIKWKQAISNALPDDTPVYIEYKEAGSTNEWQSLASSSQNLGNYEWQGTLAGATNYNYNIWCYYVPPAPVHTNGIWTYNTLKDKQNKYILPLRAEVRDGGEVIATPKSKWDYEANDEAYWFKHYAPNTALRIDLNYNDAGDNSFGLVIWPTTAETVVTVDWGDGTTTVTNSGSTADYLLEHTYASRKEYVVVIGDTLARPIHFYRAWYVYRKRWPWAVKNFMRWGDSAKNLYESLLYCQNCVGMTPRWPEGAEAVSQVYCDTKMTGPAWPWPKNHEPWARETYAGCRTLTGTIPEWDDGWGSAGQTYWGCTGLTGAIPKWGKNQINASCTYYGCTGLTGAIPKWGKKMTSVKSVYRGCTGLTGAWTTDPDELMPTNMQHDAYVVADASPELRALFYEDWGGTKKRPTTDE